MSNSSRFGFTREGLSADDIDELDAILAADETHDHSGGDRLTDPADAPDLALDSTTGFLPGGQTFYYCYGLVDQFGLETATSDQTAIATPPQIAAPSAPAVVSAAGGTLASGPTYYALSAVTASGDETPLSNPTLLSISDQRTAHVTAPFPLPTGVSSYNVWRQGPLDAGFTKIGAAPADGSAFADDGSVPPDPCPCDPSNLPPASNLTSSTNTITLTVGTDDQPLLTSGAVKAVRWYRSISPVFVSPSLLAQVSTQVNTDTESGGVDPTYADDGTVSPVTGTPRATSATLTPSVALSGGGGGGGGGGSFPRYRATVMDLGSDSSGFPSLTPDSTTADLLHTDSGTPRTLTRTGNTDLIDAVADANGGGVIEVHYDPYGNRFMFTLQVAVSGLDTASDGVLMTVAAVNADSSDPVQQWSFTTASSRWGSVQLLACSGELPPGNDRLQVSLLAESIASGETFTVQSFAGTLIALSTAQPL